MLTQKTAGEPFKPFPGKFRKNVKMSAIQGPFEISTV